MVELSEVEVVRRLKHAWSRGQILRLNIALFQLLGFEHGNYPWPGGS